MTEAAEPEWSEAEHEEIMRLHIIEGLTISEAKLLVFRRRVPSANKF